MELPIDFCGGIGKIIGPRYSQKTSMPKVKLRGMVWFLRAPRAFLTHTTKWLSYALLISQL